MAKYVTDIAVSLNQAQEKDLQAQGFDKINVSLNPAGNPVYIWYNKQPGAHPITRIQVSCETGMSDGLIKASYTKVTTSPSPGGEVFLWYFSGSTEFDTNIVSLAVSTNNDDEASMMKHGMERIGHNMSWFNGSWCHLWVMREKPTYICDVTATNSFDSDVDLFQAGYIRIDDTTNTFHWGKSTNFLWYRHTPDAKRALTDLQISTTTSEYQQWQQQGYNPVKVNLNEGTGGNLVYLWFMTEEYKLPVKSILLLLDKSATPTFEKAGVTVNCKNINVDNADHERYLCFFNKQ